MYLREWIKFTEPQGKEFFYTAPSTGQGLFEIVKFNLRKSQ